MKTKMILKIITDIAMTAALLLLMTYELIWENAHEWIGVAMFVLFILHHILNSSWSSQLLRGKYTAVRTLQTIFVVLILLSMIGAMSSGVILSRQVFAFITVRGWRSFARNLHMISAYWGFVLMSLHLGFHWNMMMGMTSKFIKKPTAIRTWTLRVIAALISGYGVYAFIRRGIGRYMLMMDHFVFFDFDELSIFFIMDYIAVMGLFVFMVHYAVAGLKKIQRNRK